MDVPSDLPAGEYSGTISFDLSGVKQTAAVLKVALTVAAAAAGKPIPNGGADDLWRMSRLGWLDSTVGIDRNITAGFEPLLLSGGGGGGGGGALVAGGSSGSSSSHMATLTGNRSLVLGTSAAGTSVTLIESIHVEAQALLATPLVFEVAGVKWRAGSSRVTQQDNMTATVETVSLSTDGRLQLNSSVVISFDGFLDTTLVLSTTLLLPTRGVVISNTTMALTIPDAASPFFMGLAKTGGNRSVRYPDGVAWKWSQNKGGENQLWSGSGSAGLRLKLKGEEFDWESPLHMQSDSHTHISWSGDNDNPVNNGTGAAVGGGGVTALPSVDGLVITASSGALTLRGGVPLVFRFDLLVTPLKALNTPRHFRRDRYYQYGYNGAGSPEEIAALGTEILNFHQGVDLNPYINYPFNPIAMEKQANFSTEARLAPALDIKHYIIRTLWI